jgi:hypothetical protein
VLFAVPWPPQGIFANQEINQIGDLKGLSWRVYNASTRRIAQMVEAHPVAIEAADLRKALATGLIQALMTSAATANDVEVWDNGEKLTAEWLVRAGPDGLAIIEALPQLTYRERFPVSDPIVPAGSSPNRSS